MTKFGFFSVARTDNQKFTVMKSAQEEHLKALQEDFPEIQDHHISHIDADPFPYQMLIRPRDAANIASELVLNQFSDSLFHDTHTYQQEREMPNAASYVTKLMQVSEMMKEA
jgi:hypothetical protein